MGQQTPLYSVYKDYPGVKITDFHGWDLPVNFSHGITSEHQSVRRAAGLFDVSHMGEILVSGDNSQDFIQKLVSNNLDKIEDKQVMYTLMCYPDGGVVDDLIVYKFNKKKFMLIVNASNREKDFTWIKNDNPVIQSMEKPPMIENVSEEWAQIAIQGPKAENILSSLIPECREIGFFRFRDDLRIQGIDAVISRTGYTGEDGFELYVKSRSAAVVWETLLQAGKEDDLIPCGLGARDSLRLEAKLPLYGHEINKDITPLEANLHHFVDLEKDDFIGKDAMVFQREQGIPRTLRGIKMLDKGVPRENYEVYHGDNRIGFVTSGMKSPSLDSFIALVLVKRGTGLKIGHEVSVSIHGKMKRAVLVKTPFYKKTGRNK